MSKNDQQSLDVSNTISHSVIVQFVQTFSHTVSTATDTSKLVRGLHWFGNPIRSSWLYRWLTKEPEPDVIVIDLRETWTVGPLIGVLDWTIRFFGKAFEGSLSQRLAISSANKFRKRPVPSISKILFGTVVIALSYWRLTGSVTTTKVIVVSLLVLLSIRGLFVTLSLEELAETKLSKYIQKVLEPPEPPES